MQAIRSITQVDTGSVTIDIPESFRGQPLEIIIMPFQVENSPSKKKSLRGCLKKYANPDLIPLEATAWQDAVGEEYEDC